VASSTGAAERPQQEPVHVLLGQLDSRPGAPLENARRAAEAIDEHPNAALAVFPELYLNGYDPSRAAGSAIAPGDPALAALAAAARAERTAIVTGFVERAADGTLFNSAACFTADGELAGVYRKTHLFGAEEQATFAPGTELPIVDLAGRRVAPLICFDVELPEPARTAARTGADLLVTVSANMDPFGADHELATRARALDNRLVHVYVNRAGTEAGRTFAGGSQVIGADGQVLAVAGRDEAVLAVALPEHVAPDPDVDYLRHVRDGLPVRASHDTAA
jgi:predicted amidohydrolase